MQEMKIDELENRAAELFEKQSLRLEQKLAAQRVIHNEIEAMRQEDKILALTEEEERMLRSFRGFRARTKPGGVFKWQTRPGGGVIETPGEVLIQDPQEVSDDV